MGLERRYRRLLRSYPRSYRAHREEEMVSALLDAAGPGQRWPGLVEAGALVGNGVVLRVRSAHEWRAGAALAGLAGIGLAAMLATSALGVAVVPAAGPDWRRAVPWALALMAVALVAASDRPWARLPSVLVAPAVVVAGAGAMGVRRGYLVPFALFLVLGSVFPPASWRARVASGALGVAVGAGSVARFVVQFGDVDGIGRVTEQSWRVDARWWMHWRVVPVGHAAWIALALLGLAAGVVRPRLAIAAGVLVVPLGLLASSVEGLVPEVLVGSAAAALALGATAAVGRRVTWQT